MDKVFTIDNNNQFLKIENSENYNLDLNQKFTISTWIKSSEVIMGSIVSKMEHDLKEYRGWDLYFHNDGKSCRIGFLIINKYPANYIHVRTSNITTLCDNNWHHIAIIYNGHRRSSGIRIFVDGRYINVETEMDSLNGEIDNNFPITIGARSNGMFNFKGSIFDVRIYKKKLGQNEIIELIQDTSNKIEKKESLHSVDLIDRQKTLLRLKNISRIFTIHHERSMDIFSKLISIASRKDKYEKLIVLDNISFELKKGEMLGILGRNGSGKTTLLKIIGKIMQPSTGNIEVYGKISPFLSLGVTFHPDLTAKQNVILYGMVLGESKSIMEEKVDDIIKFAELEKFSDVKIRNFSTGMNMRLAFSTAISIDPDILLIDEVLSVGDYSFQQKSLEAFLKIKNSGKSIVFVSHNLEQLEKFCDKLILLDNGKMIDYGEPEDIISKYLEIIK